MKILQNIPGLAFLAKNVFWADMYAKGIDYVRKHGDTNREKALIKEVCAGFAQRIMDKWDWTVNASGSENLPKDGPVVFISNHQGYADILAFMHCVPFQCGFIAKAELSGIPHFSKWIPRIRGLYITRNNARESLRTLQEGAKYLKQGFSMVIFPEGTRSRGPEPGRFHAGSFKLATKAGVPIVPVTIDGSYRLFEETGVITRHQSFDVTFHPPISLSGLDRKALSELPSEVEEIILKALKG